MVFFTYQCDKDKSLVKHCSGEGVGNKAVIYGFVSVTRRRIWQHYQDDKGTKLWHRNSISGNIILQTHVCKDSGWFWLFTAASFII